MKKIILLFVLLFLLTDFAFASSSWTRSCTSCSWANNPEEPGCGYFVSRDENCGGCVPSYSGRSCDQFTCDWNNLWGVGDGCTYNPSYYTCVADSCATCSSGPDLDCWACVTWSSACGTCTPSYTTCTSYTFTCYDVETLGSASGSVTCNCWPGYFNCDGNSETCEEDIWVTRGTISSCSSVDCNSGWLSCDGNALNGCEQDKDVSHGTLSGCSVNNLACDTGWSNCDTSYSNGCEVNNYDDAKCGSSCTACTGGAHCINSQCVSPDSIARVAAEIDNDSPDWWKGNTNILTMNCQSNPTYCTSTLHGYDGDINYLYDFVVDSGTIVDYTGYIKCSQSYYKNCNWASEPSITTGSTNMNSISSALNGCESDIRHFNTACGSCSSSCDTNNQWCWHGSCINKTGFDYTHGSCSGTTASCSANSVLDSSNPSNYGTNTCAWGGSPKCNCNTGYKNCDRVAGSSCETNIYTNISNCGGCDTPSFEGECINRANCSGWDTPAYRLGRTKAEVCEFTCTTGTCSALTKTTGYCDYSVTAQQCVSPYVCVDNNIQNVGWCCPAGKCSYNGSCYDEFYAFNVGSNYYYCKNVNNKMTWLTISRNLDVAKMVNLNHRGVANIADSLLFNDFGFTKTCGASTACAYSKGYSYNYCFSFNIVFDGIFNLETDSFVPIKVSEQALYDPYAPIEEIVNVEGCTELDCSQ